MDLRNTIDDESVQFTIRRDHLIYDKIKDMSQNKIISLIEMGLRAEKIIETKMGVEDGYQEIMNILSNKLDKKLDMVLVAKEDNSLLLSMNTQKGKLAERKVFESLTEFLPDAEIEDTGYKPGKGDIIIRYLDVCIMLEIKNYSKNVPSSEKDKFHRDLLASEEYNAGIMMSCCSGICNTTNIAQGIAYRQLGNKFAVYLSNAGFSCTERLVWAILFIVTLQQYCTVTSDMEINPHRVAAYVSGKLAQIESCVTEITDMQGLLDNHKINMIKTLNNGVSALEISITFLRKRLQSVVNDFRLLHVKKVMNDDMSILQLDSAKAQKNRLENLSLLELKRVAKSMKLKKYSQMNKTDIIAFLKKSRKEKLAKNQITKEKKEKEKK